MPENNLQLVRARILIQRLERLSADSVWAHKASGVRASLDKLIAGMEIINDDPELVDMLDSLIQGGFEILNKAAQSIPSPEDILNKNNG
jgi:hypothetical protein